MGDNELGNHFVNRVTEANRSIISDGFRPLDFRNENYMGLIKVFWNLSCKKSFFNFLPHEITHKPPKPLEKSHMKLVRTRSFIGLHGPKRFLNFLGGNHCIYSKLCFFRELHLPMANWNWGPRHLHLKGGV